jgi:hypothetical protein
VRGKKAAIAREWGLCLLEGGQFAEGDAAIYESVRKNVDYHIQQLGKAPLLAPPVAAASASVPAFTSGAPSCCIIAPPTDRSIPAAVQQNAGPAVRLSGCTAH